MGYIYSMSLTIFGTCFEKMLCSPFNDLSLVTSFLQKNQNRLFFVRPLID